METTRTLRDLYAYNTWANAKVFETSRVVDRTRLEAAEAGTYGTLDETLKHLIEIEDVYYYMLIEEPPQTIVSQDEYFGHDLAWFAERARQLGADYANLLAHIDDAFLAQPLNVPWFDFKLTKHDGLLQVLSHSAQHRAQVFSVLGERGHKVPDLDYVLFVGETQSSAS